VVCVMQTTPRLISSKQKFLLASDVTAKETAGSVCPPPKHVNYNDVDP
jgi:hypothetical protein